MCSSNFDLIVSELKNYNSYNFLKETLEDQIKKSYTLNPWRNTLVERSSLSGKTLEFIRKWSPFQLSGNENKRWKQLFREAFHNQEESIKRMPVLQQSVLYELQYKYAQKSKEQLFQKTESKSPKAPAPLHWTQDPAILKQLSLLNFKTETDETLDLQILETLFGQNKNLYQNHELIEKLNLHIDKKLNKDKFDNAPCLSTLLKNASHVEANLQTIIKESRTIDFKAGTEKLKTLSESTVQSLGDLKPGEKWLVFGGTPAVAPVIKENSGEFLQNFNNIDGKLDKLLDDLCGKLDIPDGNNLLPHELQEKIGQLLNEGIAAAFFPQIKNPLVSEDQNIFKKMLLALPELVRRGIKLSLENTEKQIYEEISKNLSGKSPQEVYQEIQKMFSDGPLKDKIKEKIKGPIQECAQQIQHKLFDGFRNLSSELPPLAKEMLASFNLIDFGSHETPIWFEIAQRENGFFDLKVFATGAATMQLQVVPLEYKNLTKEQLNSDFFLRLYSYRAWPVWDSSYNYNVNDIHHGLLASLKTDPTLPEQPQDNLAADLNHIQAPWGLFKGLLSANLRFETAEKRELYYFQWKKESLINLWQQLDSKSVHERTAVGNLANDLLMEGAKFFEAGLIPFEDLKQLYATVWDIQEIVKTSSDQTKSPALFPSTKPYMAPRQLVEELKILFGSINKNSIQLIKRCLIDVLGSEFGTFLDEVLKEFSIGSDHTPLPPIAPAHTPLSLRVQVLNFTHRAFYQICDFTLGVNPDDFITPNIISCFKIAILVGRVGLLILFPSFSITINFYWIATFIATSAIKETVCTLFPLQIQKLMEWEEQVLGFNRRLQEWQTHLFVNGLCKLLLKENELVAFNAIIAGWQAKLTHGGKLSFELKTAAKETKKPLQFQKKVMVFSTKKSAPEIVQAPPPSFLPPLPDFTADNCLQNLEACLKEIQELNASESKTKEVIIGSRLLALFKALPMPLPGDQKDVWSELKDYDSALELVSQLTLEFYKVKFLSIEEENQAFILLYKSYAIIDKLARRSPEANLKEYSPNPSGLAILKQNAFFKIFDPYVQEQFTQICTYFGIERNKVYSESDIRKYASTALFFKGDYNSVEVNSGLSWTFGKINDALGKITGADPWMYISPAEEKYFGNLLKKPEVQQKLEECGISKSTSDLEKFAALFTSPSSQNLIPRAFHLLRFANLMANTNLSSSQKLEISNLDKFPITFETKYNSLHKFLTDIPQVGHFFKKENLNDKVNQFFAPNTFTFRSKGRENAAFVQQQLLNNYDDTFSGRYFGAGGTNDNQVRRTKKILINYLHSTTHTQNDILNNVPCFKKPREVSVAKAVGINDPTLETLLSTLSPRDRAAIEMIWADEEDQAVRALSYFKQQKHHFDDEAFLFLLLTVLLRADVLEKQLKSDPHFIETLGSFFKEVLNSVGFKDPSNRIEFVNIGIVALSKARFFDANAHKFFPDFSEILRGINCSSSYQVKSLVANSLIRLYQYCKPEKSSLEEKIKATKDYLKVLSFNLGPYENSRFATSLFQWEPEIAKILNQQVETRNEILSQLAWDKELLDKKKTYAWSGNYPNFYCGDISLKLDFLAYSPIEWKRSSNSSEVMDSNLIDKIADELRPLFPDIPLPSINKTPWGFKACGINIIPQDDSRPEEIKFKFMHDGKTWVVQEGKEGNDSKSYWLDKANQSIYIVDGKSTVSTPAKKLRKGVYGFYQNENQLEKIDLNKEQHQLGLLDWFQPLDSIEVYRGNQASEGIKKINFSKLNLSFDVVNEGGTLRAISKEMPGFHIAEEQRQDKRIPALNQHTRYLLLDNTQNQNKVILPTENLATEITTWLMRKMVNVETSHLIDLQLSKYLDKFNFNSLLKTNCPPYFTYNIDASGRLISDEPMALFYLLLHSLAQDRVDDMHYYLKLLEGLGKRLPYSKGIFSIVNMLNVMGIAIRFPYLQRLTLRLSAICEENQLIQMNENLDDEKLKDDKIEFFSWIGIQTNLLNYLKNKDFLGDLPLSEYQELFILHRIVIQSKNLLKSQMDGSSKANQLLSILGEDTILDHLMHPALAKRYHYLKQKYAMEGECSDPGIKEVLQGVIQDKLNTMAPVSADVVKKGAAPSSVQGSSNPTTLIQSIFSVMKPLIPYYEIFGPRSFNITTLPTCLEQLELAVGTLPPNILEGTPEAENFKLKSLKFIEQMNGSRKVSLPAWVAANPKYKDLFNIQELRNLNEEYLACKGTYTEKKCIDKISYALKDIYIRCMAKMAKGSWKKLPVHFTDLSLKLLRNEFLGYYQLAMGKPPLDIEGNPEKKKQFLAKSKAFKENLIIAKGKSKEEEQLLEGLRLASEGSQFFPDPQTLEKQLKQHDHLQKEYLNDERQGVDFSNATEKYRTNLNEIINFNHDFELAHSKARVFSPSNKELALTFLKKQAPSLALTVGVNFLPSMLGYALPWPLAAGIQGGMMAYKGLQAYEYVKSIVHRIENEKAEIKVEREVLDAKNQKVEAPLPDEWLKQLKAEDAKFIDFSQNMLKEHFNPAASNEQQEKEVEPFECPSNSPMMQKVFARMNQNIKDFYARPKAKSLPTEFKNIESYYKLKNELERAHKQLQIVVENEKKKLSQPKNKKIEKRSDQEVLLEALKSKREAKYSDAELSVDAKFDLLLKAFINNDDAELLRCSGRHESSLPKLKLALYRYLVQSTRLQQLERALQMQKKIDPARLADDEMQIRLKQLTFELGRERAYSFENIPVRLMRGYLAFEYGSKTLLWDRQVNQLQRMLLDGHDRIVLELITGSGKTFFGTPMTSFYGCNGNKAIHNCFPESLAPENIKDLAPRSKDIFGQIANAMKISRETIMNADKLWAMLRVHMRCVHLKEHLNSCKNDLQALELLFIEACHQVGQKLPAELKNLLFYYMKLLLFIRTKERGNVDEAHRLFIYNDELNHPLGDKKKVKKNYVNLISECMRLLVVVPEIASALQIDKNDQTLCNSKAYHEKIKPLLANELAKFRLFSIEPEQRPLFISYLSGNVKDIPEFVLNHPKRSEIGLAVGVLNKILPDALEKKVNVHFGTKGNPHGFAQPYNAKDTPREGSTFKNPFEAVLKTLMASLYAPLTSEQTEKLIFRMKVMANNESKKRKIPLEDTSQYQFFNKWTEGKFRLFDAHKDLEVLTKQLNLSYGARMTFARLFAVPEIDYFIQNLSSNSQNFASMFSEFYAGTASPNSDETLPTNTKVLWDNGTEGKFLDFICKNVDDDKIIGLDNRLPEAALDEILAKLFDNGSNKVALIDSGALLFGISNEKVADKFLEHIEKKRPDKKGIVFFNSKNELVIKEKGKDAIPLANSQLPLEQRLTYYDQVHTFGADIQQAIGSEGVVTISEDADCDFEKLFQGSGRMRGLDSAKQTISIVTSKVVKERLLSKKQAAIRDVISFTKIAEAKGFEVSSFPSVQQQMANITRRAVLDKMIMAPDVETMLQIFKKFSNLLITKTEDDPFELYGYPEEDIPKEKALELLRKQHYAIIRDSFWFNMQEKEAIKKQLDAIGLNNTLRETVKLYKRDGEYHLKANDLGMGQQVSAQQNQNQNQDQNQNQNQNQNLQLEMNVVSDQRKLGEKLRKEPAAWDKNVNYFASLDWLKASDENALDPQKAQLYSVAESMSKSSLNAYSSVFKAFEGNLFWSNNMRGILDGGIFHSPKLADLDSHHVKPIMELLIIQDASKGDDSSIISIALDQSEANFWRAQLADNRKNAQDLGPYKIGLFDLALNKVVNEGKKGFNVQKLQENEAFDLDCARWRFLAGHVELQKDSNRESEGKKLLSTIFSEWLEQNGLEKMKNVYSSIYKMRGITPFNESDMQNFFAVDENLFAEMI